MPLGNGFKLFSKKRLGMAIAELSSLSRKQALISVTALIAGVALVALPLERAIEIIGNGSFAATFISYAQSDIIRLRLIAITNLSMGLIYNTYVHLHMPEGQGGVN